ncbi:MAG: hypothetical protein ACJA0Z_000207 [Halioglobus sp.]|jgi:hypothetical protein
MECSSSGRFDRSLGWLDVLFAEIWTIDSRVFELISELSGFHIRMNEDFFLFLCLDAQSACKSRWLGV